jgi:Tfp pilus assembly protein FimV
VNTVKPIKEPIVQFLMEIIEKQGRTLQLYTFLIDPPIRTQSAPATSFSILEPDQVDSESEPLEQGALIAVLEPEVVTEEIVEVVPVVTSTSVAEPNNTAMPATIRVVGKGISLIAQESVLHQRFSVYQIMRAFYLENGDVFEKRNISKLTSVREFADGAC